MRALCAPRRRRGKGGATAGRTAPARLLGALGLLLAACGAPDGRAELCARVIPALDPEAADPRIVREGGGGDRVRLTYTAGTGDGAPSRRIECRFGGEAGATLTGVRLAGAPGNDGALSPLGLFLLREYWLKRGGGVPKAPAASAPSPALVGVQQAINAATLAAIYGMLGAGYGLVWALLGRVNLAFGEFAAVGGFAAFTTVALLALIGPLALPLALPPALLAAMVVGGAYGLAVERAVFRPLAGVAAQAPLIATAGLILVFREYLRLAQGAEDRWLPPWFEAVPLAPSGTGFVPTVNAGQGLVLVLSAGTGVALVLLIRRTGFGRRFRACCDDPGMAALCGVDPARTAALTFALAGASAGAAGFVFLAYYGGIGFSTGIAIGFKALTAAVIGGLGSVPGAFLGGAVVGGVEVFWTATLGAGFRDVAVFALLAAFLVWRPDGLAGTRRTPEER